MGLIVFDSVEGFDGKAWLATAEGELSLEWIRGWMKQRFLTGVSVVTWGELNDAVVGEFLVADSAKVFACVDRLVEVGEIRKVSAPGLWGQHERYAAGVGLS